MPKQKDLKRIVRSRMEKTGESYTAARLQLTKKKDAETRGHGDAETPVDYAAIAGMSDSAIQKNTRKNWSEWVETLDAVEAAGKPHGEIAKYVSSVGVPMWWTQAVTVGYERIKGLRQKGQRRGGDFEASKSRTLPVPVAKLFSAWSNARVRKRWLRETVTVRTSTAPKSMRLNWDDGTVIHLWFTAKGRDKSVVAVQHTKLPSREAADKMKAFWSSRLDALSEILSD